MPVFDKDQLLLTRRAFVSASATFATLPWLQGCRATAGGTSSSKTLINGIVHDPIYLTAAITSAGEAQWISPKVFDGLLQYSNDLEPSAGLATASVALAIGRRPGRKARVKKALKVG